MDYGCHIGVSRKTGIPECTKVIRLFALYSTDGATSAKKSF